MRLTLFAALIGLGGIAILVWLGTWQVQRLGWKQTLLSEIDATIADAPVPVSQAIDPFQRYAPVSLQGTFGEGHVRVLASRKQIGPVYRVLRPFEDASIGRVIVDTGWIRDGVTVADAPVGEMSLIGNLNNPNEIDSFTPEPDLNRNIWFARDVAALAEQFNAQPIMVVLREMPESDLGVTPWPVDTAGIPNDHLQYAITWFSLAAIWGGMTLYFLLRTSRSRKES